MKKQISFKVADTNQLKESAIEYFTLSGFKFVKTDGDKLKFINSSSIFDAWKTNPLNWGSEIMISLNGNEVTADFYVETESQMNSAEEKNVWTNFIMNFEIFFKEKTAFEHVKSNLITKVKRSRLIYVDWTVLGALVGGFIGILFFNFTGSNTIAYLLIPVMATLFLKNSVSYKKQKNTV